MKIGNLSHNSLGKKSKLFLWVIDSSTVVDCSNAFQNNFEDIGRPKLQLKHLIASESKMGDAVILKYISEIRNKN